MPIQAKCLSEMPLEMGGESLPECELSIFAPELANPGRWIISKVVFPSTVYDELWHLYGSNHSAFAEKWKGSTHEIQMGFIQHARQHLTAFIYPEHSSACRPPSWKSIQFLLDRGQQALLHAAIVAEVANHIESFLACATMLRGWAAQTTDSEKIDRSLEEAERCYFFVLFTACAITCHAVLEDENRQMLPQRLREILNTPYRGAATLRQLLREINDNLFSTSRPPEYDRLANRVRDIGKTGSSLGLLSDKEAEDCLAKARAGLQVLQLHPA